MTATVLSVSFGLLSGIVGFVMGALLQQDASFRGIQTAMANDPYIFQSRQNIFKAVSLEISQLSFPLSFFFFIYIFLFISLNILESILILHSAFLS